MSIGNYGNVCNAGELLYRDRSRVVEFLLHTENKYQIVPINVETTQAHVFLI